MKTFATTLAAGLIAAGSAFAQGAADRSADALNARQLESLRGATAAPAAVAPAAAPAASSPLRGLYVGASVDAGGTNLRDHQTWGNSLTLGYELNRNVAVEAVASYNYSNSRHEAGQTGFVNLVVGQPIGSVTPYVLAGAGAGINGAGDHHKNAEALWNVGGGLAYNVTRNWQIDARYRYVDAWQGNREAEHAVSLGVNYRF